MAKVYDEVNFVRRMPLNLHHLRVSLSPECWDMGHQAQLKKKSIWLIGYLLYEMRVGRECRSSNWRSEDSVVHIPGIELRFLFHLSHLEAGHGVCCLPSPSYRKHRLFKVTLCASVAPLRSRNPLGSRLKLTLNRSAHTLEHSSGPNLFVVASTGWYLSFQPLRLYVACANILCVLMTYCVY